MGTQKRDPAAGNGRGRGNSRWHASSSTNNQVARPRQDPIHVELIGSTICITAGLKVDTGSPVLAMCRRLIEAGYDPGAPLHAYRDKFLCLVVRSIGEGAKLKVNTSATGFIAHQELAFADMTYGVIAEQSGGFASDEDSDACFEQCLSNGRKYECEPEYAALLYLDRTPEPAPEQQKRVLH